MRLTTKKYLAIIGFTISTLFAAGQTATLCIANPEKIDVAVDLNELTFETKSADLCIHNIPFEIFALSVPTPSGDSKKLVFGRLGDTTYVKVSPSGFSKAKNLGSNALLAYAFGGEDEAQIAKRAFSDSAKKEMELAEASKTNQNTAPKLDVQTEQLQTANKKPSGLLISKPKDEEENGNCEDFLTDSELKGIRNLLKKTKSLDLQLSIAQSSLKNKCLSCNQLQDIFKLIEEDDLKVNLFKRLYPQITDPEKRKTLFSEFLFETSVDEIKAYGL